MSYKTKFSYAARGNTKLTVTAILILAIITWATQSFSADCGSPEDCERLGGDFEKNKELTKSFEYYKKSCDLNGSHGCFKSGAAYFHGYGVEKSLVKAEPFLLKANQLDGKGKRLLAGIYEKSARNYETGSEGVFKNETKAIEFYKKLFSITETEVNKKNKIRDEMTPLALAIRDGFEAKVKALLELGADPNAQDKYGFTPLMEAILANRHDILTLLLSNKGDPYVRSNNCYDSMRLAIKKEQHESIKSLVKFGYDINHYFPREYMGSDKNKVDCEFNDNQPLVYVASTTNNIGIAKTIINLGADVKNERLLAHAQLELSFVDHQKNNINILSGILGNLQSKGASTTNTNNLITKSTGRKDNYKMVDFLLSKGASPSCWAIYFVRNRDIFDLYLRNGGNINCFEDKRSLLYNLMRGSTINDDEVGKLVVYKINKIVNLNHVDLEIRNIDSSSNNISDLLKETEEAFRRNPSYVGTAFHVRYTEAAKLYRVALSSKKTLKHQ